MNLFSFPRSAGHRSARWPGWLTALALLVSALNAVAQAPSAPAATSAPLSAEELSKLVGPIALYPDDLVAIILPASTSPLQIVQADRYLEKRKSDPKLPVDAKWDDPVKSLLNYPDVVKMMSNDLDWTSALGEAVVADQGAVLEAVQVFRRKAKAAGNLKSDSKQVVKTEQETIIIEPADPQVIYVPQYNPSTVVVYSATPVYGYYPTPYPVYYYPYPPGAAVAARHRLGRSDWRRLERQPLRLWRRRREHHRQQQHQCQPQHQRQSSGRQRAGRRLSMEIEQAAGTGEQFSRQIVAVQSCG